MTGSTMPIPVSRARRALLAAAILAPALSACASDTTRYPSLAVRDAERMHGSVPAPDAPPPAPVPTQPPADLPGRLAAISQSADAAHALFQQREAAARSRATAAARAEPGTLAWSDAEVALSSLESARSDTMFALADLDAMLAVGTVDEAESGVPAGLPLIEAARERVEALVAAEDAVLAELRGL